MKDADVWIKNISLNIVSSGGLFRTRQQNISFIKYGEFIWPAKQLSVSKEVT
jgi:hypothetical protein